MRTITNPSARLLKALGLTSADLKYERTCRSNTCSCFSHDNGYDYLEIEETRLEGLEIHHYSGSVHSHGYTVLREEYVEKHTAKGIPRNAPEWAYTLNTSSTENGYCHGKYVTVEEDGDFTVVKLLEGRNSCVRMSGWFGEVKLFASKNGLDCTKEYRGIRFRRLRDQRVSGFIEKGLSENEANRLFQIGKDQWTREQEYLLTGKAETLRQAVPYQLNRMATRHSYRALCTAADEAGILDLVSGMSHPRAVEFAKKALWVFHGRHVSNEDETPLIEGSLPINSLAQAFDNAR